MAYKDSDELKTDERYPLGDYSFRIERSSVPSSTNDKIEAICTDKDGKNARKSIQLPSTTKMGGWYVEANGTEATVYAVVQVQEGGSEYSDPDFPDVMQPVDAYTYHYEYIGQGISPEAVEITGGPMSAWGFVTGNYLFMSVVAIGPVHVIVNPGEHQSEYDYTPDKSYTHDGKTVNYCTVPAYSLWLDRGGYAEPYQAISDGITKTYSEERAWILAYGTPSGGEYVTKEMMIGRFAIELEDAGGVGPGSDWVDPGDYDPDWEPEDPTHTLYVTVTGALSGRHNDPIEDPSYSYIPADKDTVKDYGCGGDGGHGGGGGAGASTVVIHKFATNQANSKEVTAIARRHGYGSGGGKGGKGGDGCILVYY